MNLIEQDGVENIMYQCLQNEIIIINGQRHLVFGFEYTGGFIRLETTKTEV